jgi:hypothetical protein
MPWAALQAYLGRQNRNEADDTPILRQRDGLPYRNKDTFARRLPRCPRIHVPR